MNLEHIHYMLNSEPMHAEIMLDSEGLKPAARVGVDTEILLELFGENLRGEWFAAYMQNLNL